MFWEPIQCSEISGALIKAGHTGGVPAGLGFPGKCLLRERISQCSRFTYGSLKWGWSERLLRACDSPLFEDQCPAITPPACDNHIDLSGELAMKRT